MKVSLKIIKEKDLDALYGLMAPIMKDIGKMIKNMDKMEYFTPIVMKSNKVSGIMVNQQIMKKVQIIKLLKMKI